MKAILQVFSFDLLSKLFLGLATIALIRYMPEQEYATYTVALSLVSLVSQGYVLAFNRLYIVGYEDLGLDGSDSGFLAIQLIGIGIIAAVAAPFLHTLGPAYVAAIALALAMCLSEYVKTWFQRDLKFFDSSMIEIARSGIFFAIVLAIIATKEITVHASYVLLAQAFSMSLVFVLARRGRTGLGGARPRLRQSLAVLKALLRGDDRYLFAYFVILAVFGQVDIFILKALSDANQLASYGSAFRYYVLLSLALGAVHTVLLPAIHHARSTGGIGAVVRQQQRLSLVFAPVVLLGAWLSGWIIPMVDTGRYPAAVPVFRLLCLSAIVSFAFSPHANLVVSDKSYRFLVTLVIAVLVIGVLLDLLLVPIAGAVGAAAGHLVAFGILNFGSYLRARRSLRSLAAPALGS